MEALEAEQKQKLIHSFKTANRFVAGLAFEPEFQVKCSQAGITSEDYNSPKYWDLVATQALDHIGSKDAEERTYDEDVLLLTASTPDAILRERDLRKGILSGDDLQDSRDLISYYTSLLASFTRKYPASYKVLQQQLLGTVMSTIGHEFKDISIFANSDILSRLKGVRHENGFKQLLDAAGIPNRDSTVDEDLRGRDYIVTVNGHEFGVDVKASLSEVDHRNNGSNGLPYSQKPNGDLVVYSLLTEKDFGDGFSISDETAQSRVPLVRQILGARKAYLSV